MNAATAITEVIYVNRFDLEPKIRRGRWRSFNQLKTMLLNAICTPNTNKI